MYVKACYAIAALAVKPEHRVKLGDAGACSAVYTAMDTHCGKSDDGQSDKDHMKVQSAFSGIQ
jgi:hypothetical protein